MLKKLILLVLALFLFAGVAQAQTEELPDPGITPDSPLYFFDTLGENIGLFFAFGDEAKTRKAVEIANEKVAEAQAMAEKGNEDAAEIAAERYGKVISTAAESLAASARSGEGFDEALAQLIAQATSIHLSVLADVYDRVPDQAKSSIERAMQESVRGGEEALNAVSGEKREEVMQQVEEKRQEVKQKLDTLRKEGKPIPNIQTGNEQGAPEGAGGAGGGNSGAQNVGRPEQVPGRP
ncbi:MAG: hypothetical protein HYW63_00870 [Candidatus Levybacteria bacterium]|nr:hypothetical protein [Candidatus Levybacteria bacterium]